MRKVRPPKFQYRPRLPHFCSRAARTQRISHAKRCSSIKYQQNLKRSFYFPFFWLLLLLEGGRRRRTQSSFQAPHQYVLRMPRRSTVRSAKHFLCPDVWSLTTISSNSSFCRSGIERGAMIASRLNLRLNASLLYGTGRALYTFDLL